MSDNRFAKIAKDEQPNTLEPSGLQNIAAKVGHEYHRTGTLKNMVL